MKTNHSFKVGDIVYNSWGWEQTNIDFFQVVRVTKASIFIREIAGDETPTQYMAGTTVAVPNEFVSDEVITKRVSTYEYNGEMSEYIKFPYGSGSKWDGKPKYVSHYA